MKAIAKTNLFLRVLDEREDGYHNLENVFIPLPSLFDDIIVIPSAQQGIRILTEDASLAGSNNLCAKAIAAFCQETGQEPAYDVQLVKRIPVAAGLGGGSSDAAATLLQLNQLSPKKLAFSALLALAAKLGADVPFFLNPVPMLGTGIGDQLQPLPLSSTLTILIAAPGFPLPVKWAFSHLVPHTPPKLQDLLSAMRQGTPDDIARLCYNDLEYSILNKFPLLRMIQGEMLRNGAYCAHVSGSGPSVFAIVPEYLGTYLLQRLARQFHDVPTLTWSLQIITPA